MSVFIPSKLLQAGIVRFLDIPLILQGHGITRNTPFVYSISPCAISTPGAAEALARRIRLPKYATGRLKLQERLDGAVGLLLDHVKGLPRPGRRESVGNEHLGCVAPALQDLQGPLEHPVLAAYVHRSRLAMPRKVRVISDAAVAFGNPDQHQCPAGPQHAHRVEKQMLIQLRN